MSGIKLFCLPFAGGSSYAFNGFVKNASLKLQVMPVELAGRGRRINELLMSDMTTIVDDIFANIQTELSQPYAIYGHSMGTLIGYLLVKKILKNPAIPPPIHLFVSGSGGPSHKYLEEPRYLMPKKRFLQALNEIGGMQEDIIRNEEMMNFFEPIMRSDFKALETYKYLKEEPFQIPITCMIGKDEKVTYEEASLWQQETTSPIEILQFSGKHFFIFQHEKQIMSAIESRLTEVNTIS